MNLRSILLKAADLIEKNEGKYSFSSIHIPGRIDGYGAPCCALGWIGAVMKSEGIKVTDIDDVAGLVTGVKCQKQFYKAMKAVDPDPDLNPYFYGFSLWKPSKVAEVLKLFTEQHYPAPKHSGIPDKIHDIFTPRPKKIKIKPGDWQKCSSGRRL